MDRNLQKMPKSKKKIPEKGIFFCFSSQCPEKKICLVGQAGLEPATPSPPDSYANHLRYCPTKKTDISKRAYT